MASEITVNIIIITVRKKYSTCDTRNSETFEGTNLEGLPEVDFLRLLQPQGNHWNTALGPVRKDNIL